MKINFSGKRPVMFYQPAAGEDYGATCGHRIRIFYPDGTADWCALGSHGNSAFIFGYSPCWLERAIEKNKKPKNMKQAIELAERYDKYKGWPKMRFVEEL